MKLISLRDGVDEVVEGTVECIMLLLSQLHPVLICSHPWLLYCMFVSLSVHLAFIANAPMHQIV